MYKNRYLWGFIAGYAKWTDFHMSPKQFDALCGVRLVISRRSYIYMIYQMRCHIWRHWLHTIHSFIYIRCILMGTLSRKAHMFHRNLTWFSIHECLLTCWPDFSISTHDLGNQSEIKDISTLRPGPGTEFRGGSWSDSQIGWGPHIFKVLPGCITAHSKTPMGEHATLNYVKLR